MEPYDPFALRGEVRLKRGREASVLRRHPWIYRGALASEPPSGFTPVAVVSSRGKLLGVALPTASGGSLALRMVAFSPEKWNLKTLQWRLQRALDLRERLPLRSNAYRLLHVEGDGFPGLVADRYADTIVLELYEPAWEAYLPFFTDFFSGFMGCRRVLLRRVYQPGSIQPLMGELPEGEILVQEGDWRLLVDVVGGQKTGLFLDQRENRYLVARLASGARVLNLFAYSGAFALAAMAGGAREVVNVDVSTRARELAERNYTLNDFPWKPEGWLVGDAFEVCHQLKARGPYFDLVIVDPPAFAKKAEAISAALTGYRKINARALPLVATGGFLLTCSCSARVTMEQLEGALLAAALEVDREVVILQRRGAGPDHPVSLFCPETRHLKALWCAVY